MRKDAEDPLMVKLRASQLSVEGWQHCRRALRHRASRESGYAAAEAIAVSLDGLIRSQADSRPTDLPCPTVPLKQLFRTTDEVIGDRAATMTNKRRADALLMLLAAQRNGWVNVDDWTAIIRAHLAQHRGHPIEQRKHTDPRTAPSLR